MRVNIDKAGRDREPGDVDLLPPAARGERADRGKAVAIESYIGADGGGTGAVEYTAAAQHKVVARHGTKPWRRSPRPRREAPAARGR